METAQVVTDKRVSKFGIRGFLQFSGVGFVRNWTQRRDGRKSKIKLQTSKLHWEMKNEESTARDMPYGCGLAQVRFAARLKG